VTEPLIIGRYMICDEIGAGGMATVHLGRLLGAAGFSRVVAIKRLHAATAESDKLATMLIDEARIVARIRHANVAPTLDVIRTDGELLLIMEYVHGPALAWLQSRLLEQRETMPPRIAVRIAIDALEGLHAAHNAKSERGRQLGIVHRDVSPQNILVGEDGVARVLDFGIAKAEGRLSFTVFGEIKGKLRYMSPEQLRGEPVDLRTDVFATGVVLWEMLAGSRLFGRPTDGATLNVLKEMLETLADVRGRLASVVPPAVEEVVVKALSIDPADRFGSADEMAVALTAALEPATPKELGAWTARIAEELLAKRRAQIEDLEQVSAVASRVAVEPVVPPTMPGDGSMTLMAPTVPMNETLPMPMQQGPPSVASPATRPMSPSNPDVARTLVSLPPVMRMTPSEPASREAHAIALPMKSRAPLLLMVGLALLVLVGGVVAVRLQRGDGRNRTIARGVAESSARSSEPPAQPPAQPPPPASATPALAQTPAPSTPAPAPRPSGGQRRAHGSATPHRPACDPPFTIDRDGVRIPRPECIGN
jgi:eukaryotic-like serine/threonine-protein kinase